MTNAEKEWSILQWSEIIQGNFSSLKYLTTSVRWKKGILYGETVVLFSSTTNKHAKQYTITIITSIKITALNFAKKALKSRKTEIYKKQKQTKQPKQKRQAKPKKFFQWVSGRSSLINQQNFIVISIVGIQWRYEYKICRLNTEGKYTIGIFVALV